MASANAPPPERRDDRTTRPITSNPEGPRIHAHAVMTGPGGIVAGHAVALTVRASVEVSITVFDTPVLRVNNQDFGLWTIDLGS